MKIKYTLIENKMKDGSIKKIYDFKAKQEYCCDILETFKEKWITNIIYFSFTHDPVITIVLTASGCGCHDYKAEEDYVIISHCPFCGEKIESEQIDKKEFIEEIYFEEFEKEIYEKKIEKVKVEKTRLVPVKSLVDNKS